MNPAFTEKKSFFPSEIVNHSLSVPHVFKKKAKKQNKDDILELREWSSYG